MVMKITSAVATVIHAVSPLLGTGAGAAAAAGAEAAAAATGAAAAGFAASVVAAGVADADTAAAEAAGDAGVWASAAPPRSRPQPRANDVARDARSRFMVSSLLS